MDLLRSWRERAPDTGRPHTTSPTTSAVKGGVGRSLVRDALGKGEALRGPSANPGSTSLSFAGQSPGGSMTFAIDIPPAVAHTLPPRAAQLSVRPSFRLATHPKGQKDARLFLE